MIAEEADIIINYDNIEDLEAREDAWAGGDNLSQPIDKSAAGGGEEATTSPETLSITDDRGVYRMSENRLRRIVRKIIKNS